MPRVQTRLDSRTGFVNAISPHLVWRSSRATPSRRVSDSSATPHLSALPKRSGGWFLILELKVRTPASLALTGMHAVPLQRLVRV